jgi:hypothetical protein
MPDARARAATSAVLPTPGLPSSSTLRLSCRARSTRRALRAVVGARKSNAAPDSAPPWGPRSTKNGGMPHVLPGDATPAVTPAQPISGGIRYAPFFLSRTRAAACFGCVNACCEGEEGGRMTENEDVA